MRRERFFGLRQSAAQYSEQIGCEPYGLLAVLIGAVPKASDVAGRHPRPAEQVPVRETVYDRPGSWPEPVAEFACGT
jgi:hypothetical protein